MPLALLALAISAYAIGTTEFVVVGLLPTVAADLSIGLPLAGLVVSVYALGVTVGAPVLTALTGRMRRKPLLPGLMGLFVAGNLLAGVAPNFETLLAARVLSAFAHGVFFSVGATIAADLVPEDRRASAIALMFSGLTVAIVTGVPMGTWIGQNFGWRATFLAVSALGVVGGLGVAALVPGGLGQPAAAGLRDQMRVLAQPRLLLAFAITALGYGGTFVAFTFLAPILETITGLSSATVSLVLVLYGAAIAVGNLVGGRLANRDPARALAWLFALQALVLFVFTVTANGAAIPALGYGTFRVSGPDVLRMVPHVLGLGYRHIDTAQIYGNEAEVGEAVASSSVARGDLFLTTKVWVDRYRDGDFQRSVEDSLKRLRTDHVDLLLLHWPNPAVPLAETVGALNAVRAAGKVRHIGVSNFPTALMAEAIQLSDAPLVTNQIEYHPYLDQGAVIAAARAAGLSVTAYYAMADGKVLADPVLAGIAAAHGRSVAQVVLRWIVQQDGLVALSKTVGEARAAENAAVFDFALSDAEMAAIHALARAGGRIVSPAGLAPTWD